MKLRVERKEDTKVTIHAEASEEELSKVKSKVLTRIGASIKVDGFRKGKVPANVVEKHVAHEVLQAEFLEEAVNKLYVAALKEENIRPVSQPQLTVNKFVPFTTLEVSLELEAVGEIKLPDYKKISVKKNEVKVEDAQIKEVLETLRTRAAEKTEVTRDAKDTDEAWIDFVGTDKDGKEIEGASGKDYPLVLGSKTFIPGFEENIVGMKMGEEKSFVVTFPKDYGQKDLQNKKVTFAVTLNKIKEVTLPKLDEEFAGKVGPFKSLAELTEAITQQLTAEAQQRVERDYEAALIDAIVDKTHVAIPEVLIDEQKELVLQEVRQNAAYRGMSFEDFLKTSKTTEEAFIEKEVKPEAIRRVKAGLTLGAIADAEGVDVTPEELEVRIQILKGQYKDPKMQAEIDKPENRRELNARIRSEKVIDFLKKS